MPGLNNVSLGFVADADGGYTIEFALSDHWATEKIWLHDLTTGDRTEVTDGGAYSFQAKRGDVPTRFSLSASGSGILTDGENAKIAVHVDGNGQIVVVNHSSNDCSVFISNTAGKLQQRLEVKAGGTQTVEIPSGTWVVRLQNAVVSDARKIVVE